MSQRENAVLERRLRPIYDCIDMGNNKKAIQEADKVLKKNPNTTCAKVLKALAMIRSERMHDAWALLDECDVDGQLHDDNTLQAFSHCYKEACAPERIARLYERMDILQPNNEQILAALFAAQCRCRDYKAQQQTAMKLFRVAGHPPYYFWAVMSCVMQAESQPLMGAKMFYPLAEKMMLKHVEKAGYKNAAEVELMCVILEGVCKPGAAAALLQQPVPRTLLADPPAFVEAKILQLLLVAREYKEVFDRAREGLASNNDDWQLWTLLFDSAFELCAEKEQRSMLKLLCCVASKNEKTKMEWTTTIASLVETLNAEKERAGAHRGPFLAAFELIVRLNKIGMQEEAKQIGDPVELLTAYVRRFHAKPCCFADTRPYLALVSSDRSSALDGELATLSEGYAQQMAAESEQNKLEGASWGVLVCERVRTVLGARPAQDRNESRAAVMRLVGWMVRAGHSDLAAAAFAQLAGATLWALYTQHGDAQCVYELMLLWEWVAQRHAPEPLAKIGLAAIYGRLGCLSLVDEQMERLDVKSVQRDSLGYFLHPLPERSGRYKLAMMHYTDHSALYDTAEREISECTIAAYKNGAFSQVPGLVRLANRMRNSQLATASDVMNRWMSSLFAVEQLDHVIETLKGDDEPIDWAALCDNRDLNVLPVLVPGDAKAMIEEIREWSSHEYLDFVRLHHVLCVSAAAIGGGEPAEGTTQKTRAASEWMQHCHNTQPTHHSPLLQAPASAHLGEFVRGGFAQPLVWLLECAARMVSAKESGSDVLQMAPHDDELKEMMRGCLSTVSSAVDSPLSVHPRIEAASRALQTLAFAQLVLKLVGHRMGVGAGGKDKKNKSPLAARLDELHTAVKELLAELGKVVFDLRPKCSDSALLPKIGDDWDKECVELLRSVELSVSTELFKGYTACVDDLATTIQTLKQ